MLGLAAVLTDLTKATFHTFNVISKGLEKIEAGDKRAVAKEYVEKTLSEVNRFSEVMLQRTLQEFRERILSVMTDLEGILAGLPNELLGKKRLTLYIDQVKSILETVRTLIESAGQHPYGSLLRGEAQLDAKELEAIKGSETFASLKVLVAPISTWALVETGITRNAIKGWEGDYVQAAMLHNGLATSQIPDFLMQLEIDLDQKVIPRYLTQASELLAICDIIPSPKLCELPRCLTLPRFLESIEQIEAARIQASNLTSFIGINIDAVSHLLEEVARVKKSTDIDDYAVDFVFTNFTVASGKWSRLKQLPEVRIAHLKLLRLVDEAKMKVNSFRAKAEFNETATKNGLSKLREKLLALGDNISGIGSSGVSGNCLFLRVPKLEPKKSKVPVEAMMFDTTGIELEEGLSQSLLSAGSNEAKIIESQANFRMGVGLLVSSALYSLNYYVLVIPAFAFANALHQSESFAVLMVGAAALGGLISLGLQRQWVNISYLHPLWFCQIAMIVGNSLLLISYIVESQSFSLLSRLFVGAGNPFFLCLSHLHDGIPKDRRTNWRFLMSVMMMLGTAAGFSISGAGFDHVDQGTDFNNVTLPCLYSGLIDLLVLILCIVFCQEADFTRTQNLNNRTQQNQGNVLQALITLSLPQIVLESAILASPLLLSGGFNWTHAEVSGILTAMMGVYLFSHILHHYLSGQVIGSFWVLLALVLGLAASSLGLGFDLSAEMYVGILICLAPGVMLVQAPGYRCLQKEHPFSEKGSLWNADFTVAFLWQVAQLVGCLWAAITTGLGLSSMAYSLFLPAFICFALAIGTILALTPDWHCVYSPFS